MIDFETNGKFITTADRKSWIDLTRISTFTMYELNGSHEELQKFFPKPVEKNDSFWVVYCNYERTSDAVAVFHTQAEARQRTELTLMAAFGSGGILPAGAAANSMRVQSLLSKGPKAS